MSIRSFLFLCLVCMTPVLELRAGIPMAVAMDMPLIPMLLLCVLCNLLPAPFIVLFIRKLLIWMDGRGKFLTRVSHFMTQHAQKKLNLYKKYQTAGLFLLVAVPLPGTGAWTGALVAGLMDMRLRRALPAIFLGLCVAAFIMTCLSYGISIFL